MTLGIDATVGYIDPDPSQRAHRAPTSRSTARTTRGCTPGCRRRRSRARASPSLARRPGPRRRAVPLLRPVRRRRAPPVQRRLRRSSCATRPSALDESRAEPPRVAGATRTVGIIGWPVDAQSLAGDPQRGVRGARARLGLRAAAGRTRSQLAGGARRARARSGFAGANVTMPHKAAVGRRVIDDLSDDAAAAAAR